MGTLLLALALTAVAGPKSIQFGITPGASPGWNLVGYVLYETTSGKPVTIANIPQTATSYILSPLPAVGIHTYELAQNGLNGSGQVVQSKGNPGATVSCWKVNGWRTCKVGRTW